MLRIDVTGDRLNNASNCEVIHLHRTAFDLEPPPAEDSDPDLDSDELFAAYLARESHVMPILRLLMDMSEEQRRLSLSLLHCVAMNAPRTPRTRP